MNPQVFLDIDINGHREAYKLAKDFVEANDLKYGFSSKNITELGGSEKKRIKDYFESDYDWCNRGRIEVEPAQHERIIIELYKSDAPLCTENFIALCKGNKGLAKNSSKPLHYKNSIFHRVLKNFVAQAGDFVFGNGTGGESIWGGKFKDEKNALKRKHDKRGIVSMGNSGKNSNGSQFFFTFGPLKSLDGKHCVFGEIISGFEVLDLIETTCTGKEDGLPSVPVVIADCGVISE